MYDETAMFIANKLKEFCEEKPNCSRCPFGYHPTCIGSGGERTAPYFDCRLGEGSPNEWVIPEEGRT